MAIRELPVAPFDSTIGAYILTPGNTQVLMGAYDSPAYPMGSVDTGWAAWISHNGGPDLFFTGDADPLDPLVNVKLPHAVGA